MRKRETERQIDTQRKTEIERQRETDRQSENVHVQPAFFGLSGLGPHPIRR